MSSPSDPSSPDFNLNLCSLSTGCPIETSYYGYVPNLGINIFFAVIYGLVICTCLALAFLRRGWLAYTIVLGVGAAMEFGGYILRTYGYQNPWELNGFTVQLVLLTIAPVFMSASVYLSLEHIAQQVGHGLFRINPKIYPRVFIPSDVAALVIQSVGGAMSSGEDETNGLSSGVKITITGLALQLCSLCVFFVFMLAIVIPGRGAIFGSAGRHPSTSTQQPHGSPDNSAREETAERKVEAGAAGSGRSVKNFVIVLLVATFLIVVRSAYRVAELSSGLSGPLITNQWLFVVMDGLFILVATCLLGFGNPILLLK